MEHLVARGDAARALTLLRRPGTPRELTYKFAPALMAAAPDATVDAWLQAQPPLDPRSAVMVELGRHLGTRRIVTGVSRCSHSWAQSLGPTA